MADDAANPQPDAQALLEDALRGGGVRFERVFSRPDEVVVVLPGRGEQAAVAREIARGLERGLNRRIEVMAADGAPRALRTVVKAGFLAFFFLATFAFVYPYIRSMVREPAPKANAANQAEAKDKDVR